MSFSSNYNELRKKRKKETESNNGSFSDKYNSLRNQREEDIAPVKTTVTEPSNEEQKERKWFQKGGFEDGYQFGDVTKTILGTINDVGENVTQAVFDATENLVDTGAYIVGSFGSKDFKDDVSEFIARDYSGELGEFTKNSIITPHGAVARVLLNGETDDYSVLGEKTDSLVQSGAHLVGQAALQYLGVPWWLTSGVNSFGSEIEQAFGEEATYGEAGLSGAITTGAELLSEKLFSGFKFQGKAVTDVITEPLMRKISGKTARTLVNLGLDATGEGFEEVFSGTISAVGQKLTYADEKEFNELFSSEDAWESFIGGAALSAGGGAININKANKTGRDYKTGLTENEQKVVDKVYEDALKEAEKDGKKLTSKEKTELYDEVIEGLKKGEIDIDTIESVLGGDTYKSYQDTVNNEVALAEKYSSIVEEYTELNKMKLGEMTGEQTDRKAELKKQIEELQTQILETQNNSPRNQLKSQLSKEVYNSLTRQVGKRTQTDDFLLESYNEEARRHQAFEVDVKKYKGKQLEIYKKAMESGVLNNTRRSHELVDMLAKLAADKDFSVELFNNKKLKESSFAIDGKNVNGFYNAKTKTIGLNVNSKKLLNSVVGHEVTHILEGTELYGELQKAVKNYAEAKGEYKARYDALKELYKGIDGADLDAEITADLIGDYLFTDSDFVNNLSVKNRNVFQKIYDEIKYLCKVATAGSKEARELEKVKRAFDKAYKESGNVEGDTKYSLEQVDGVDYVKAEKNIFIKEDGTLASEREVFNSLVGKTISLSDGEVKIVKNLPGKEMYKELFNRQPRYKKGVEDVKQLNSDVNYNMKELLTNSEAISVNEADVENRHQAQGITSFDTRKVKFYDGSNAYNIEFSIATLQNGEKIAYAKKFFGYDEELTKKIQATETRGFTNTPMNQQPDTNSISQNSEKSRGNVKKSLSSENLDSDTKYSLSDSDGKQLTKEQREYFKDSKMRDDNGNLKVMYHGSQDAGFHTFDANMSDDDTSFFFVDRNDVAASYSGTSETYEAQTIRTAEDMNNFLAKIGYDSYEAVEKDGKFELLENNEHVAYSDTAQGLYDEFCWYEGVGEGDANYKVYLNLTNPLEIDAKGRPWNKIDAEFSQEVYDKYQSLTAEEKAALTDLAEWEDFRLFNSEIQEANGNELASAYARMGEDCNIYDLFSVAADNFSEESLRENSRKYLKTRDFAQRAKEQGYDGVIFKNLIDNGGYSNGSEGASTVAIAFESNQIKSVANEKPTGNADIRYSLSEDNQGRKLSAEQREYFKGSKVVDENGGLKVMYHGTPNGDFSIFKDGTYFTENKWYADLYQNPGASSISTGKVATNPKTFEVYLNIQKPFDINDAEARSIYINDYIKGGNAVGINPYLSDAEYNKISSIDWTEGEDLRDFLIDNGYDYDGLVLDEGAVGGYGDDVKYRGKSYVVFRPEQVKNVDNLNPTSNPDIRYSLSSENEQPIRHGNFHISGDDVRLEAPIKESVAPTEETVSKTENVAETESVAETALEPEDYVPLTEEEANRLQSERVDSLSDEDAPPEIEAPYYEDENVTVDDPFESRDIKGVGNRKVKAYMYENPEVKPFFQAEANVMLGELRNTVKGERWYNPDSYNWSYDEAQMRSAYSGTKRQTTGDIAYLLDNLNYTYAEIEKGLNAIIEDNGKENNACSKRIEFLLNDRLLHGYQDETFGLDVPPNQEYINLVNEKQITEYSEEAFKSYLESVGDAAVPAYNEDIAPVAESTPKIEKVSSETVEDIAPSPTYETANSKQVKGQRSMFPDAEEEQPKVAKILTEEPETPKRKNSAFNKARANLLDKGAVIEDLSLKTGNRELQAKYNFMHYSESRAQEHIADNLKPIVDKVEKSGKTEQLYEYVYHLHNIDRMSLETEENRVKRESLRAQFKGYSEKQIENIAMEWIKKDTPEDMVKRIKAAREYIEARKGKNKPVFGDTVTADVSRETVKKLEAENPEFKELSEAIIEYNNQLRKMLVDGNVISQETADLWAKMYPHYVPIRRVDADGLNINVPLDTRKTGVNAPIKRATGGNSDILPLFDTMAMRTEQTFKAIAKNSFGTELMHSLDSVVENEDTNLDEVIDSFDNHEELLQKGKKGKNPTFTVFENGKRVTFEITEDIYDAMKPTSEGLKYTNKVANTASNIFRGLLTEYNPVFMVSNAAKDVQDVLINSQHAGKTYANIPKAIKELSTKGKWYTEYMKNGGSQNTYFDGESKTFKKENKGFIKAVGMPLRAISEANNFIERVPRLAEYIASREAGASIETAMLDAARVTTNFAAGGDVTKFLNRNGVTFLNASVQGFNQQVRNVREAKANGFKGWLSLAAKVAIAGLPVLLLNNLLWDDDEEYEELSDYVKDNYYVVAKTENGTFIRIPKGRTVAVIQGAVELIENAATGEDEVDLNDIKDLGELAWANLAPNNPIENNILAPIMQVKNNKTWYGEDLVPTRLQDLPAAEQYDESTDSFSRWIGETFNVSPYKVNYLLNQYSGGVGDVVLPMFTPEAESGDNSFVGNMIAPLKDKFTTDSVMNNQNVSDFYDTMDELTVNAKGANATDEDILKYKYFNSVNSELGELYALKREVQNSDLPDDKKYAKVREIQEEINAYAREALNSYEYVENDGNYAVVGDRYYRKDDNGKWQKITDKQLEQQGDVTEELGISGSDYWSDKSEYDFAYENPEKYAVAKSVGGYEAYKTYASELYDIKADKDENGKSIRGSRKEKVIDYINNLDASYGEKIILLKSEYNADDTYNQEIIDYLNSRDDISYDEMKAILIELGFTVDDNGNIYWD